MFGFVRNCRENSKKKKRKAKEKEKKSLIRSRFWYVSFNTFVFSINVLLLSSCLF